MAIICTGEGRVLTIKISGEVDHHGAKSMIEAMERHIEAVLPTALTLDLAGITFMDSSGIALLLRAHRRLRGLEGTLTVVNTPAQALRVLRAAGIDKLIALTEQEAYI